MGVEGIRGRVGNARHQDLQKRKMVKSNKPLADPATGDDESTRAINQLTLQTKKVN
jgi:hypothetical protein